jgi:two-component sensor histidine kinase
MSASLAGSPDDKKIPKRRVTTEPAERWESEGAMPREHVPLSEAYLAAGFDDRGARETASYERSASQLRKSLAAAEALVAQKEEQLRHQEFLTQECNHRLLNNLQIIVSLLSLQSSKEATAEGAKSLAVAASRVGAIARLHRHLHSMDGTPTVQFKKYLDGLCRDLSTMSMSPDQPNRTIAVDGVEISLPTDVGIPLGLIANELVTNAIKHGEGRITATLAEHPETGYALSVANEGPALPHGFDPAACEGLGMTLVSRLAAQIGGELRIDRDGATGTKFTVFFPR